MISFKKYKQIFNKRLIISIILVSAILFSGSVAYAGKICGAAPNQTVNTNINLGCTGKGNPILDLLFAVIRFLSAGVGIIIIFSTVLAGIQYTVSRDSPEAVQKAKGRLVSNLFALLLFLFSYAILNFLIPGGFFN
jgi:hypothetical protein